MLNALRSDRSLQAALAVMAVLGASYLVNAVVSIGAEFRSVSEQRHREQAVLRHEAVCRQLGKGQEAPDHSRCLDLLEELRGWHEHAVAERNMGIL